MKHVTRIQTSDGILHDTFLKAERHADERYGAAVTALAHKLVRLEKYTDAVEFLESNIAALVQLDALKKDVELEPSEDND